MRLDNVCSWRAVILRVHPSPCVVFRCAPTFVRESCPSAPRPSAPAHTATTARQPGSIAPGAAPTTPPACTSATPRRTPPRGPPSAASSAAPPPGPSGPTSGTVRPFAASQALQIRTPSNTFYATPPQHPRRRGGNPARSRVRSTVKTSWSGRKVPTRPFPAPTKEPQLTSCPRTPLRQPLRP